MELPLSDPRPVGQILADQASRYRDKPFLLFQDQTISYAAMHERARACAGALWTNGIRPGDKVGIFVSNRPEFLEALYGLLTIGAVEVPINTAYRGDLLAYVLNHSGAKAIIIEAELFPRLVEIGARVPELRQVWTIGEAVGSGAAGWNVLPFRFEQSKTVLPDLRVRNTDLSGIVYTSGTTGPAKGVMCTHHYFYNFSAGWSRAVRLTPDDVYYTCLPLFHFAAQVGTTYTSLVTGATVVIGKSFTPEDTWQTMRRYGVTGMTILGSLCHLLYKQPTGPQDRDHRVRFCWTAPAPAAIFEDFQRRFGVRLLEGYGMTETNIPLQTPYDAPRPGSCGKPWDGFEVDIFDENDWPVRPDVVGEIVTRPRLPSTMMAGYYNMPEKTVEAWRNLWFHTGDRGRKDKDGYFYFVDRMKDSIRRRGENISSYEIEKVVDDHPAVLESAAVAVPAEVGEDEVKVVVVLRPGVGVDYRGIVEHCAKRLAHFMVPKYIEIVPDLPKTPNGKVQKHKLRAAGVTASTWDRETAGVRLRDLIV